MIFVSDHKEIMRHYNLVFLGFGNVGQALARLLLRKQIEIQQQYAITYSMTAVATHRHGRACDPDGLHIDQVLDVMRSGKTLDSLSVSEAPSDNLQFLRHSRGDVLFENTPVNYENGQPAIDHIRAALETGMHACTANKGALVHGYNELTQLAAKKNKRFYFESTVMDGAPIFSIFRQLPAANVHSIRGILNSTTNLILTRMQQGEDFEQALDYAQHIGIAETDPNGDIQGWDAAIKLAALVTVIMGVPLKPQQVDRVGIDEVIDLTHFKSTISNGKRWKQLCTASRDGNLVKARVAPELIEPSHPFYNTEGTSSIVQFESDVLGPLAIMETDPTPDCTAFGLLADFINAVTGK